MENKRLVEHYKDHQISCAAELDVAGWRYSVSIVRHSGDDSDVVTLKADDTYASDIEALRAGIGAARVAVDARSPD